MGMYIDYFFPRLTGAWEMTIAFWGTYVFAAFGIAVAIAEWFRRRAKIRNQIATRCAHCGYDASGLDICPECGFDVRRPKLEARLSGKRRVRLALLTFVPMVVSFSLLCFMPLTTLNAVVFVVMLAVLFGSIPIAITTFALHVFFILNNEPGRRLTLVAAVLVACYWALFFPTAYFIVIEMVADV